MNDPNMITVTVELYAIATAQASLESRLADVRKCAEKNPLDPYWQERAQELQRHLTELKRALAAGEPT